MDKVISLIRENINNLKNFNQKFGKQIIEHFLGEKDILINQIKDINDQIEKALKEHKFVNENVDNYIKQIEKYKKLCYIEDYTIFDNLINILKKNDSMECDDENEEIPENHEDKKKKIDQVLKTIDKQLIKQKISEEYTNDMLGRALSKAEYFSKRYGKNHEGDILFNYYNRFDNGITKEKINLKKSLMNVLDSLQDYYEMDKKKIFPSNFNQKQIEIYIEKLRDNCEKEDQDIFNNFITIIQGGHVDFSSNFNSNCKVNPQNLVDSGVSSMKYINKQEKEWKERAKREGDYPIGLKFNQNWEANNSIPKNWIHSSNNVS